MNEKLEHDEDTRQYIQEGAGGGKLHYKSNDFYDDDDDDDDNFLSQEARVTLVANCVTVVIKSRLFFPLGKAES